MLCPVCQVALIMTDRNGVEIDYCPKCRGVWLDRGELEKLIERNSQYDQKPSPNFNQPNSGKDKYYDDNYYKGQKYKKKESFLGELFDF